MTPQATHQLLHSVLSLEGIEESFVHLRDAAMEYEEEMMESLFNLLKFKFCEDAYAYAEQEVEGEETI